jgi:hypothetical protein
MALPMACSPPALRESAFGQQIYSVRSRKRSNCTAQCLKLYWLTRGASRLLLFVKNGIRSVPYNEGVTACGDPIIEKASYFKGTGAPPPAICTLTRPASRLRSRLPPMEPASERELPVPQMSEAIWAMAEAEMAL